MNNLFKTIICFLALTLMAETTTAPKPRPRPRWLSYEKWRDDLDFTKRQIAPPPKLSSNRRQTRTQNRTTPQQKTSMTRRSFSPSAVRKILGKPLYIRKRGSYGETWYYQYRPIIEKKRTPDRKEIVETEKILMYSETQKGEQTDKVLMYLEQQVSKTVSGEEYLTVTLPTVGYVCFSHKGGKGNSLGPLVAIGLREPDWTAAFNGKYDLYQPPVKLQPIRKLQPHEKEKVWGNLRRGMDEKVVRKLLGEPVQIGHDDTASWFYYTIPPQVIKLEFKNEKLRNWGEPNWMLVEYYLYKEVKDEPTEKKND